MITPRRTRLVRVPDLQSFRRAIAAVAAESAPLRPLIVVPTHAAARVMGEDWQRAGRSRPGDLVTREQLYQRLHAALPNPPLQLTAFERDAMMQSAALAASSAVGDLPFKVRPGLVAEILRFYDQLRRQSQSVQRFAELLTAALGGGGELADRGAERLLRQTDFLVRTFHGYQQRLADSGACDEHTLRSRLLAESGDPAFHHVIVTVPDWIADPDGLFVADFELLARLPQLARLDAICTTAVLGSGFHERVHGWWPGLEEIEANVLIGPQPAARPRLASPASADELWTTHRDREEELAAIARRIEHHDGAPERMAVVFKHPLPYLYLAPDVFGAVPIPYRTYDALPLATEPSVAPLDLLLDAVESDFTRDTLIALLGSPYVVSAADVNRQSIALLNHALSDSRYLGGVERLEALSASLDAGATAPAYRAALQLARMLSPLAGPAPASHKVRALSSVLATSLRPESELPLTVHEQRARAAVQEILDGLAAAHAGHHDPMWELGDLASAIRRWVGERLSAAPDTTAGLALLDDRAARYGEFDDLTIVGLVEQDWPERPRRNIFYTPALLKSLGWPSERDRRSADDARFLDLLGSASVRVELSTFTLDDETLVSRSVQLDEVPRAHLSTVPYGLEASDPDAKADAGAAAVSASAQEWLTFRSERPPASDPRFHGEVDPLESRSWSVSALETYLGCPFKFFAQHVLQLQEEPDDEEVMDPRRQGQFVHEVFESFFRDWQDRGYKTITGDLLDTARSLFESVVDRSLGKLPEGERALEQARLLGTSAASGLGEAVFRMEAERPEPVVERLLEHPLRGTFTIATDAGPRQVALKGKADRIDLLADGTFRLIDYKLGWPPDRNRALQLPIYSICAEQLLAGHRGRNWTTGEAVYLAFKGPKRVVPLFTSVEQRAETLIRAQRRVVETIESIGRGQFPPTPDDVYRCETCSFAAVCRKDYVGAV